MIIMSSATLVHSLSAVGKGLTTPANTASELFLDHFATEIDSFHRGLHDINIYGNQWLGMLILNKTSRNILAVCPQNLAP